MGGSKRSGAPVTASRADPFRAARWRLALLYAATIAAIVSALSAALYGYHSRDVESIGRRGAPRVSDAERGDDAGPWLAEYLEHLGRSIIIADVITIAAGGAVGWLLAARTLRPIREAVKAEQKFFANAAHDLRTPLSVMASEAEVALRGGRLDAAQARQVLTSSLEEIRRMSVMVEQMLDLGRIGAGALRTGPRNPLDLASLARAAAARMTRRAQERGVRLAAEGAGPLLIAGDETALERAVSNVLDNAIAYTPCGGSVTVCVRREGAEAVLAVEDTGIGIAPKDLPHISEPFFRGDAARGVHAGGAGLGLTITKTTVDEHGGSFHAANRPGGGASISLRFPALP